MSVDMANSNTEASGNIVDALSCKSPEESTALYDEWACGYDKVGCHTDHREYLYQYSHFHQQIVMLGQNSDYTVRSGHTYTNTLKLRFHLCYVWVTTCYVLCSLDC
jgi:hypothetical protein